MDLFHFSHDPSIERFTPHVPATNPTQPASVWAIDAERAPLHWFPRDCQRVAVWPRDDAERHLFSQAFCTAAPRVHAIELGRLRVLASAGITIATASIPRRSGRGQRHLGQWISDRAVEPSEVERLDDLIGCHVTAGIELRAVPDLWPIRDLAVSGPWDFSVVRFQLAAAR